MLCHRSSQTFLGVLFVNRDKLFFQLRPLNLSIQKQSATGKIKLAVYLEEIIAVHESG